MLLDPRLQRQRYGRVFLESLPPYRVTKDIAEVEAFFAASSGITTWFSAIEGFVIPAILGNIVGGVVFVAILNHGQVSRKKS